MKIIKAKSRALVKDDFQSLIQTFLSSLDVGENSKRIYRIGLENFLGWLKRENRQKPQREDIIVYKESLRKQDLSPLTISVYLVSVRLFFAYLESRLFYPNIARGIKGMKRAPGHFKEALTSSQARRLLDCIELKDDDLISYRDLAMINLMIRTGLRTIEISRANIEDIGSESGETVLRIQGKGYEGKDSFVILTDESYHPILDYLQKRGSYKRAEPLFISHSNRSPREKLGTRSIRRIVKDRLALAGLKTERISAHSLRHTTASLAIEAGANIVNVRDMMRHSDINTTMIYVHSKKRISEGAEKLIRF